MLTLKNDGTAGAFFVGEDSFLTVAFLSVCSLSGIGFLSLTCSFDCVLICSFKDSFGGDASVFTIVFVLVAVGGGGGGGGTTIVGAVGVVVVFCAGGGCSDIGVAFCCKSVLFSCLDSSSLSFLVFVSAFAGGGVTSFLISCPCGFCCTLLTGVSFLLIFEASGVS